MGVIKHDVSKFCGVYKSVLSLNQSHTSLEDVLDHSLDLYKVRHQKQQPFLFVHCWRILKDFPRWFDSVNSSPSFQPVRSPIIPKRKTPLVQATSGSEHSGAMSEPVDVESMTNVTEQIHTKRPVRPQGSKSAKEDAPYAKRRRLQCKPRHE